MTDRHAGLIWCLERCALHARLLLELTDPEFVLSEHEEGALHAKAQRLAGDLTALVELAKSGGDE